VTWLTHTFAAPSVAASMFVVFIIKLETPQGSQPFVPNSFICCRVKYDKYLQHKPLRSQAGGSVGQGLTWCHTLSGRLADWRPHDKGAARLMCFMLSLFSRCWQCLYSLCAVPVAVKRLNTSNAPASAESLFWKEIQSLQLASSICHRACRMLGLCKLDGDACIVMTLYPKSAAKRLKSSKFSVQLLTYVAFTVLAKPIWQ